MTMSVRHSKPPDGITLEVEFNHHGVLLTDHPPVVARLDCDNLWGGKFHGAAVSILDLDFAPNEKSYVGVHAQIGADQSLHVGGPPEPRRVHHAFDPAGAGLDNLQQDTADLAAVGSLQRGNYWIAGTHVSVLRPVFVFLRIDARFYMNSGVLSPKFIPPRKFKLPF